MHSKTKAQRKAAKERRLEPIINIEPWFDASPSLQPVPLPTPVPWSIEKGANVAPDAKEEVKGGEDSVEGLEDYQTEKPVKEPEDVSEALADAMHASDMGGEFTPTEPLPPWIGLARPKPAPRAPFMLREELPPRRELPMPESASRKRNAVETFKMDRQLVQFSTEATQEDELSVDEGTDEEPMDPDTFTFSTAAAESPSNHDSLLLDALRTIEVKDLTDLAGFYARLHFDPLTVVSMVQRLPICPGFSESFLNVQCCEYFLTSIQGNLLEDLPRADDAGVCASFRRCAQGILAYASKANGPRSPSQQLISVVVGRDRSAASMAPEGGAVPVGARGRLNDSQHHARLEASRRGCTLIQGPPGTGKTQVCANILQDYAAKGINESALGTADNHEVVTGMTLGLMRAGVRAGERVLRIATGKARGSMPSKVLPAVVSLNFSRKCQQLRSAGIVTMTPHSIASIPDRLGQRPFKLRRVVFDENCQARESTSLVAMGRGCIQVALIGDPNQLPASVQSEHAIAAGLDCSLFERLMRHGTDMDGEGIDYVTLLIQYRMHPEISRFPSLNIYDGRVQDGRIEIASLPAGIRWPAAYRVAVIDTVGGEEKVGHSFQNTHEADLIACLVQQLVRPATGERGVGAADITVIAPYKLQVAAIRRSLAAACEAFASSVQVVALDRFQGGENKVVLLSCVRSNSDGKVGFFSDDRRLTVGITRAEDAFIALCSVRTFAGCGGLWSAWLGWAEAEGIVVQEGDLAQGVISGEG